MLFLATSVVVTTLLAAFAAAQNTTFDPSKVDLSTKNGWCNGEHTNCPLLCGGMANTINNTCYGATLDYNCTCSNGSAPNDIAQYQGTLPNFICEATFQQCREENPGSTACVTCGTLQATNVPMITPSSSVASSASATGSASAASGPSSSSSKGAGPIETVLPAGLAGGLLAALLL